MSNSSKIPNWVIYYKYFHKLRDFSVWFYVYSWNNQYQLKRVYCICKDHLIKSLIGSVNCVQSKCTDRRRSGFKSLYYLHSKISEPKQLRIISNLLWLWYLFLHYFWISLSYLWLYVVLLGFFLEKCKYTKNDKSVLTLCLRCLCGHLWIRLTEPHGFFFRYLYVLPCTFPVYHMRCHHCHSHRVF